MKISTKRWWYTPPDTSDWFFVHVRQIFQAIFKCKHAWKHDLDICHGESHGLDKSNRYCDICRKEQFLVYHRYGNLRTEWKDRPRFNPELP